MKKYIFITSLLILSFLSLIVHPVSAHTLKIDGNFGITIHIDPDDEPVAGYESKILFDIQDKTKQFNPSTPGNCDCFLAIESEGKQLTSMPLISGNQFAQLRYTFPQTGTYSLKVSGKWNGAGQTFEPFNATFTYYVGGEPNSQKEKRITESNTLKTYLPFVILIGIGSIVTLFLFLIHISSYE